MANTGSVLLSGTLLDNSGNPLAGETIALAYQVAGGVATSLGSVTTNSSGAFSTTVTVPAGTWIFTATFAAVTGYDAASATSAPTAVSVKTVLTLVVTVQ